MQETIPQLSIMFRSMEITKNGRLYVTALRYRDARYVSYGYAIGVHAVGYVYSRCEEDTVY